MRDMRQAARHVLLKFAENGETEDLERFRETLEKLQRQEPTEGGAALLQKINTTLNQRKQEG